MVVVDVMSSFSISICTKLVKHRSLKRILPKGPITFLKRLKVTAAIKVIATLKYEMLELQECHAFGLLRLCCHEEYGVILCPVF